VWGRVEIGLVAPDFITGLIVCWIGLQYGVWGCRIQLGWCLCGLCGSEQVVQILSGVIVVVLGGGGSLSFFVFVVLLGW